MPAGSYHLLPLPAVAHFLPDGATAPLLLGIHAAVLLDADSDPEGKVDSSGTWVDVQSVLTKVQTSSLAILYSA